MATTATFVKHIDEQDDYAFDFDAQLGSGEALAGSPTVTVRKRDDSGEEVVWTDKTSEFGSLSAGISGTQVTFTLNPSTSDGDQEDSPYLIVCEVDVDSGRTLVDTEYLTTHRLGDAD